MCTQSLVDCTKNSFLRALLCCLAVPAQDLSVRRLNSVNPTLCLVFPGVLTTTTAHHCDVTERKRAVLGNCYLFW